MSERSPGAGATMSSALNYVSQKMLTVVNDSYITAFEVCAMLYKIADEYGIMEVHLVLDNARNQKC